MMGHKYCYYAHQPMGFFVTFFIVMGGIIMKKNVSKFEKEVLKNVKKSKKKYEKETLRETFYAIQNVVPYNKKAHYDGREIKWERYTFEDFASSVIEVLEDEEEWKKFYKLKTNVEKIYMFVKGSRNAYLLTQRLPDECVVRKEMLYVIEGGVFSGS